MLQTVTRRIKVAGPGLVWAAAAIGSGELVIGTKTGADYGYSFLWALWLGLWLKWSIHRAVLDVTVYSELPVVDVWRRKRLGATVLVYWIVYFLLIVAGLSGLLGLTAVALQLAIPAIPATAWAFVVIILTVAALYHRRYETFERVMLVFCLVLVIGTVGTVLLAAPRPADLVDWSLPVSASASLLVMSLLGWGAGSGPDLILPYSEWITEKHDLSADGEKTLRVARADLGAGYVVTGVVATAFMVAGAAVLAPRGLSITDADVIETLSVILTNTYGKWALAVFLLAVTAAFGSTLIGVLDGACGTVHRAVLLLTGRETRSPADLRSTRGRALLVCLFSIAPLVLFLSVGQPVALVVVAGLVSAASMPLLGVLVLTDRMGPAMRGKRLSRMHVVNIAVAIVLYVALLVVNIVRLW